MILQFFALLILLTIIHTSSEQELHTKVICEGQARRIACPSYTRLDILYANYGRTNPYLCPYYEDPEMRTNCRSDKSDRIVRKLCQNMISCKLWADNKVFSDPCPGQKKYLEIEYVCWPSYKMDEMKK